MAALRPGNVAGGAVVTVPWSRVTAGEALEIERLLRAGHSMVQVRAMTGRSEPTVRAVRDACGIAVHGAGRRPAPRPEPPVEGPEGGYEPSGDPCEFLHVLRPQQDRWVELLRTANPAQRERMRRAVCRVLRVAYAVTGEALAAAALADRRSAEQLAAAYLTEVGL
jgi:hypothetical protein